MAAAESGAGAPGVARGAGAGADAVVAVTREGIEPTVPAIGPDDVLSETWSELAWNRLVTGGGVAIGSWHGEPGRLRIDDQPHDELSVIQSGRVAIVADGGARSEFGAGEAFVLRAGFSGVWETLEPTDKVYALQVPK
ncbi:cupin domain-containing protein [Conexibacter sp. JD483]|uniref:cupin domain-containing protein n=1 Tax=unclassified Conexibacter TaxID=2627773 RepID=UPI0027275FD3|nr:MULTISPECIES: cupin domain-containing protein [unclassified Conexibacter]MDO8186457.1 cupin domain-containing protein [Conexibacter sp. CPCC 205706]MDO8200026.1 cupin domain-containing protein [Conexibacter sp. CPCC 205762]MDR9370579.1 cupin domain-containing protein [Conexibacter sp. JD483]